MLHLVFRSLRYIWQLVVVMEVVVVLMLRMVASVRVHLVSMIAHCLAAAKQRFGRVVAPCTATVSPTAGFC